MFSNQPSLADIAAVTGNNRNDGMFGGDGWWAIIIFAMIFGWGGFGGNGWGNNGGGALQGYATQSDIQRGFDTSNIVGKLDGISSGLCDGFYAQNTTLMNGFHGVDNAICNMGYQTQQGFNNTNVALMQGQNALQAQLADCCCQNREAISQVRFDMAQDTCALQNTMNTNTRDIIDSQNAGTRAILDYLCNEKISSLQAENNDLRRAASQDRQSALLTTQMAAQTQQIINAVNPAPIPAYSVPNPNVYYGCNNGCGC
nr:MAG TPA: hypothetical protein [Caudoviricetes sp.]DAQ38140.1 MAG TPA: hypothetical protein [Caudoviricetes sp.]